MLGSTLYRKDPAMWIRKSPWMGICIRAQEFTTISEEPVTEELEETTTILYTNTEVLLTSTESQN